MQDSEPSVSRFRPGDNPQARHVPTVHKGLAHRSSPQAGLTGYGVSASEISANTGMSWPMIALKGDDRARGGSDTLIPHGPRDP
jgi:hypothetical protein